MSDHGVNDDAPGTAPGGRPRLVLVAAVAENGVIGTGDAMPWRLPSDLKRFKAETLGHPMLMGRRTYLSIGRPLPGRDTVVVTADPSFAPEGVHVAPTLPAAIEEAGRLAAGRGVGDIMVVGGGVLYASLIDVADRLSITEVHARPEGTVMFPRIDPAMWREVSRQGPVQGPADSAPVSYVAYERISHDS